MGNWLKSFGAAIGAAALGAAGQYSGITNPKAYFGGLLGAVLTAVVGSIVSSVVHTATTPPPAPPASTTPPAA